MLAKSMSLIFFLLMYVALTTLVYLIGHASLGS